MIESVKVFAKFVAILFTIVFLFLLSTGIASDVYLMLTVPDDETHLIFNDAKDFESWDTVQK